MVADALSRQPVAEINLVTTKSTTSGQWLKTRLAEVRKQPENFPDYAVINNQLYRHFSRAINDEDCTPWKLCVAVPLRETFIKENHDNSSGIWVLGKPLIKSLVDITGQECSEI